MDRFPHGLPFQSRVQDSASDADEDSAETMVEHAEDAWSLNALEEAYQRALEAADDIADQAEAVTTSPNDEIQAAGVTAPADQTVDTGAADSQVAESPPSPNVSAKKVLEALLFVGGDPLTGRRLADLLGGEHLHEEVDELLSQLDAQYSAQSRPYHIQLGEGGYRLGLRPEFESVRNRVYGFGPKDVRLAQDALEILALVAFQQPIRRPAIEATGKTNVAHTLRQLLRLELIVLERGDGGKDDITYRTTRRFLELFSLDRLEDLPHPEDLMFK